MASDEREISLLPSELLIQNEELDVFSKEFNNNVSINNIMVSPRGRLRGLESSLSSCGSSSAYSSWSEFGSPISSELGSSSTSESINESEEDEELFISELTRQMTEYMLQDDDDDDKISVSNYVPENSEKASESRSVCYHNSNGFMNKSEIPNSDSAANVRRLNVGKIQNDDYSTYDEQFPPVQVYQLKNQPGMGKQGSSGGRRVEATESTHQYNKEQQNMALRYYGHGKKTISSVPVLRSPQTPAAAGSGMRAVFLGGSERNGSSGTGVFLPIGTYSTPQPKKKSGCSTVLIPARVLQTLQRHFNRVGGLSPSNASSSSTNIPWQNDVLARINGLLSQQKEQAEFQTGAASAAADINHHEEDVQVQLPQEWTY
ncbi:hypothetical protein ACH5RR_020717 [Cinchona calisaya]|uniref:Uncharacterized protein n=1 Tax=Cinchona calisaya TaxID=153742 RepID=A0ABD2ZFD7_9GENT